jgi:hypothetical protein
VEDVRGRGRGVAGAWGAWQGRGGGRAFIVWWMPGALPFAGAAILLAYVAGRGDGAMGDDGQPYVVDCDETRYVW